MSRKNEEYPGNLILGNFTPQGRTFSGVFAYIDDLGYKITAPGAAGIRQVADKGFHVVPIVATDSIGCWNELETEDFVNEEPIFNPAKGEVECGGMPIVSLLARDLGEKKQQKIVVLGCADCISNSEFSKGRNGIKAGNYELVLQTGLWFSDGYFPVNTNRPERPDNQLRYIKYSQLGWIKGLFMGLIPVSFALTGILIWFRRKRY